MLIAGLRAGTEGTHQLGEPQVQGLKKIKI
jgi:hypothetical protein